MGVCLPLLPQSVADVNGIVCFKDGPALFSSQDSGNPMGTADFGND